MFEECKEHGLIGCRDAACYTAPRQPPQSRRGGFRRGSGAPAIEAEHHGDCVGECGGHISPGEEIVAVEEMRPLGAGYSRVKVGWRHVDCQ